MALTGVEWYEGAAREELVDVQACSDHMNKNYKHIGRGSVCGICIKVCPSYGKVSNII
jgi:epoxyqueuosine reductase QueG